MENHLIQSEKVEVPALVRSDLIALNATVAIHVQNKMRLQDKLANPLLSDLSSLPQYRKLLEKTIAMINHLQIEISKQIEKL